VRGDGGRFTTPPRRDWKTLGRILESEQNGRLAIAFVEDLSGIEQHRATADPREVAEAEGLPRTSRRSRNLSKPASIHPRSGQRSTWRTA
jgi:hypothetical protein